MIPSAVAGARSFVPGMRPADVPAGAAADAAPAGAMLAFADVFAALTGAAFTPETGAGAAGRSRSRAGTGAPLEAADTAGSSADVPNASEFVMMTVVADVPPTPVPVPVPVTDAASVGTAELAVGSLPALATEPAGDRLASRGDSIASGAADGSAIDAEAPTRDSISSGGAPPLAPDPRRTARGNQSPNAAPQPIGHVAAPQAAEALAAAITQATADTSAAPMAAPSPDTEVPALMAPPGPDAAPNANRPGVTGAMPTASAAPEADAPPVVAVGGAAEREATPVAPQAAVTGHDRTPVAANALTLTTGAVPARDPGARSVPPTQSQSAPLPDATVAATRLAQAAVLASAATVGDGSQARSAGPVGAAVAAGSAGPSAALARALRAGAVDGEPTPAPIAVPGTPTTAGASSGQSSAFDTYSRSHRHEAPPSGSTRSGELRDGVGPALPMLAATVARELRMPADAPALILTDAAAPSSGSLDDVLPAQIVRSIRMQWSAGTGEARVHLRPEYLGELTVALKVEQGVVTATLHTETPEVRRWIESHTASLRDGLLEHGLRLDRLVVSDEPAAPEQGESGERNARGESDQPPARRRRPKPPTPYSTFDLAT